MSQDVPVITQCGNSYRFEWQQLGVEALVRYANRTKAQNGGWPGPAPTGYINDRDAKVLRSDPDMAPIVKLVFETYLREDISLSRLVRRARDLGLRTRKGGALSKGPLHKLLTNPIYYGVVRYEGVLYPGNHEPLISKNLFDSVQERLHGKSSPLTRRSFPYRGLMTCGYCGCNITASLIKKKYIYYHCTRGKGACSQAFTPEKRIGELFLPVVERSGENALVQYPAPKASVDEGKPRHVYAQSGCRRGNSGECGTEHMKTS
jgi:hypothetical protein